MRLILIVLLALGLLVSCGDDGENGGGGGNGGLLGEMRARVDGTLWQSTIALCYIVDYPDPEDEDVVYLSGVRREISGQETTYSSISFSFDYHEISPPDTIAYPYESPQGVGHMAWYSSCTTDPTCGYMSTSGKLIITSWGGIGGKAQGTFEFVAVNIFESDTVYVTQGYFNVPISRQAP